MQKRINIQNKRARFEYELLDQFTAGIVLTGTEIKSIRNSKASIAESFCEFNEKGELFVVNMYIEEYAFGTRFNHRPRGSRKLLLQKKVEVVKMKAAPEKPKDFALILENAQGEKKQIYFENPNIEDSNAILEELEFFADAIQNDQTVVVSLENGTRALELAHQIMECCKD